MRRTSILFLNLAAIWLPLLTVLAHADVFIVPCNDPSQQPPLHRVESLVNGATYFLYNCTTQIDFSSTSVNNVAVIAVGGVVAPTVTVSMAADCKNISVSISDVNRGASLSSVCARTSSGGNLMNILRLVGETSAAASVRITVSRSNLCFTDVPNSVIDIYVSELSSFSLVVANDSVIEYKNAAFAFMSILVVRRLNNASIDVSTSLVAMNTTTWEKSLFRISVVPPAAGAPQYFPLQGVKFNATQSIFTLRIDCSSSASDCYREPNVVNNDDGDSTSAIVAFTSTRTEVYFSNISFFAVDCHFTVIAVPPPNPVRVSFQAMVLYIGSPESTTIQDSVVVIQRGSVLLRSTEMAAVVFADANGTVQNCVIRIQSVGGEGGAHAQYVDHSITYGKTDRSNCVVWLNSIRVKNSTIELIELQPSLYSLSGEPANYPTLVGNGSVTSVFTSLLHVRGLTDNTRIVISRCAPLMDARNGSIPLYGAALPLVIISGSSVVALVLLERPLLSVATNITIVNSSVSASVGFGIVESSTTPLTTLVVSVVVAVYFGGSCTNCVIQLSSVLMRLAEMSFPISRAQSLQRVGNVAYISQNITAFWVSFDLFALGIAAQLPTFVISTIAEKSKRQLGLLQQTNATVALRDSTIISPTESTMAASSKLASPAASIRDCAALVSLPPVVIGLALTITGASLRPGSPTLALSVWWFPVHAVSCALGCRLEGGGASGDVPVAIVVRQCQGLWSMFVTAANSTFVTTSETGTTDSGVTLLFESSAWFGLPVGRSAPYGATSYAVIAVAAGASLTLKTSQVSGRPPVFVLAGNQIVDFYGLIQQRSLFADNPLSGPALDLEQGCNAIKVPVATATYKAVDRPTIGGGITSKDLTTWVYYPTGTIHVLQLPLFPTPDAETVVVTCTGLSGPPTATNTKPLPKTEALGVPLPTTGSLQTARTATGVTLYTALVKAVVAASLHSATGGLAMMSLLQSARGALQLRRLCIAATNAGDGSSNGGDDDAPFADPVDNPLMLSLPSILSPAAFGLEYAVGAVIGNTGTAVATGIIVDLASRIRRRFVSRGDVVNEDLNLPHERQQVVVRSIHRLLRKLLPAGGAPASFIMPYSLLLQPSVAAAVLIIGHDSRSVVTIVVALVGLFLWCGPLVASFRAVVIPSAEDFPWHTIDKADRISAQASPSHRLSKKPSGRRGGKQTVVQVLQCALVDALGVVRRVTQISLTACEEWAPGRQKKRLTKKHKPHSDHRQSPATVQPLILFAQRYSPLFEAFRFSRRWFGVAGELTSAAASAFVQGAALSVALSSDATADDVCSASDWGTAVLIVISAVLLTSYVSLRPYVTYYDNGMALMLATLAVASEVCSLFPSDTAQDGSNNLATASAIIAVVVPLLAGLCDSLLEDGMRGERASQKAASVDEQVTSMRIASTHSLPMPQQLSTAATGASNDVQVPVMSTQLEQLQLLLQSICQSR
ncbi:membrane-associated protein, putative [Bodo saltans]|uniref:Membrane-associated protein, putative n=1 Tax=Bodo saltans TaxID=75058 RepID=A0A0S4IS56_BODSA|nr:membrane-associated protein, putative [Bodo saltans]|eukprot:CUF60880.1 membrane-associated protein, putative [Bodo saltans]